MTDVPAPSLAIGIGSSPAERRQLAQLLGGTEAFLIVSSAEQARKFLDAAAAGPAAMVAPPVETVIDATVSDDDRPPATLRIDSDRRVLHWLDREIELTPLEHDVLLCLVGAPGQVWTYERLHVEVWGNQHLGRGSHMHSVVRRVRRKLARLDATATIQAVRGVGFRLAAA
ncbi:transcriptional regulator [Micromonospora craterilacus]|uniref:Transcriptional regulator n=1 Tax=Micromonospora craterilacus TaxID=1655439 RepID=A0A2W2E454_9ACTN|nr:winged helix-turn-helix domain-containing protein [Micromonospora craterilacus]PZG19056.1 transcriptional regulator [Micromonospora craterilacus]